MYGLNEFALILFCGLNVLAVRLCRRPERTRRRVLRSLCAALLTCNTLRYGLPPLAGAALRVPVEFSAVA